MELRCGNELVQKLLFSVLMSPMAIPSKPKLREAPTASIATRLLVMRAKNWGLNLFYTHDGNKNVSEVFYHAPQNGIAAHYDYAPFGAVTRTSRATRVTNRDFLSENPFRFSSEYHDLTLGLVYYNYRHYNPQDGRWSGRDRIEEDKIKNRFLFIQNAPTIFHDHLGLITTMSQYMEQAEVTHKASAAVAEDLREKAHNWFMQWYNENEDLSWIKDLPPCPCCLTVKGGKFSPPEDPNFKKTLSEKPKEHPKARANASNFAEDSRGIRGRRDPRRHA